MSPDRSTIPPSISLRALIEDLDIVEIRSGDLPLSIERSQSSGEDLLERTIHAVTRDSREADPSSVFVAIRGARVDGHDLVSEVDAAAVVVEASVAARPGVITIRVRDTKRALALLSAALHGYPGRELRVVAVTGTNGKTTITTVLEQALLRLGVRVGRIGTTGNAICGVPRPTAFTTPEAPALQALLAEMRAEGCDVVAMEASSIGLAQHRVDAIPFAVGVFTNLTQDHLDFHGTMAAYREAKARLFRELLREPGGMPRAVICADDPAADAIGAPSDRWTYGEAPGADIRIRSAEIHSGGTRIVLATPDGEHVVDSRMVGRHNAANLAAAFAVLRCLGIEAQAAAEALGSVDGAPGRLERIPDPAGRLVVVDYAHSDDALANVLPTMRELTAGRLWVLFGCGGDRDRDKRPKMGAVARRLADRVVLTSDNPRSEDPARIVDEILAGIPDRTGVHVELDRGEAIRWVLAQAAPGDAVLIAGKGHETTQEIAGERRPFDDRAVARRALEGA